MPVEGRFLTGVNYWPRRKAMYWWSDFDRAEVADEFDIIASLGLVALVAAPSSAQRHPPLDTLRASAAVLAEFRENTLPKVPTA